MKKYDPYNTPTLGRVKPKKHFFHSLLKRHWYRSETGLVEDRTNSVTIIRIIGGLLLLHLIIIGGVLLRGHLVRDGGSATSPTSVGSPPGVTATAPAVHPPAPVAVLPPTQQVTPTVDASPQNHITVAAGAEEEDVAEEVPEDDVVSIPAPTSDPVYHMVATGDTWQNVADQYAVSATALRAANPTVSEEELSVGSTLIVPTGRASGRDVPAPADATPAPRSSSARAENTPAPETSRVHVVQSGETLSKIARKEKVPMKELMRLNRIQNADRIRPGMHLKLGR